MKKIGITGTIAAGKTSVSILLKRRGFPVFNCDQYAKLTRHKGNPVFEQLITEFGDEIKDDSGDIDAKKLAERIFCDETARKKVNDLTHPFIKEGMMRFFENHQDMPFVFAEVPLLFEAGLEDYFDEILVVTTSKETAISRMMEDRDYSRDEAEARFNSQYDPAYQTAHANQVIHNDGTLKDLDHEINLYVGRLRKEARKHGA